MATIAVDRDQLDRVIAFINGKGGVGKTTLCANVGGIIASEGHRVLLVDMDPQGNLGLDLGYADGEQDDAGRSLAAALMELTEDVTVLKDVRPGLDVIVGGSRLHSAAAALGAAQQGKTSRDALARVLMPFAGEYDVILIDCPPGNESLQSAAIGATRWVVAPSGADEGTGRGLSELALRLESVLDVNPRVGLLGIALFDIEKSAKRVEAEARSMVAEFVGREDVLFKTSIRHAKAVAQQARKYGSLVHELEEHAKNQPEWWKIRRGEAKGDRISLASGGVAEDMHALTIEMLERLYELEGQEA